MKFIRGILGLTLLAMATPALAEDKVDLKKVIGNWEVSEFTVDGVRAPFEKKSDKIPAGYKGSESREQYQITNDKFRLISSDELAVTLDFQLPYHFRENEIVPENRKDLSLGAFNVLSVDDQKMVVGPTGEHSPENLRLVLKRIPDSELAINKLKLLNQNLTMHLADDADINVKTKFSATYLGGLTQDLDHKISCAVFKDKAKNFGFFMDTWRVQGDKISMSSKDPNLSLEAHVDFDWSKPEEEVASVIPSTPNELQSDVLGTMASGGQEFRLRENGTCDLHLFRKGRFLKLIGSCSGVKITDKNASTLSHVGNLVITSNCVLSMQ